MPEGRRTCASFAKGFKFAKIIIMEKNIIKASPKDVFLHLLGIITLYASAISFIFLVFEYINIWLPDPLAGNSFAPDFSYNSIRWYISVLIIVFPVYVLVSWFLNMSYDKFPEKRDLRIRKWLIYFTLFLASIIIIGDLVTLIYNLLGGELTQRFLLKIVTVFFVAGSIFGYYLADIKRHKTE